MEMVQRLRLKNGIEILWEHIPHIRSILLGLWVNRGSRHEVKDEFGLAHFCEHMLFKGTKRRNSLQVAESLEVLGGELNAFTSREHCCYYGRATSDCSDIVFDVLSDLIFDSLFDLVEMEKEKGVILQEIDMIEDNPEELVHELSVQGMYSQYLGHPVIGTAKSVQSFDRQKLLHFHAKTYQPRNLCLTVVGNCDHMDLPALAEKYFGQNQMQQFELPALKKEACKTFIQAKYKSVEQCHLSLSWHCMPMTHPDRYILHLISSYLGGGMASVLFQRIREQLGLVYSIYAYVRAYVDTGSIGIYSAHSSESTEEILGEIKIILDQLCQTGIDSSRLIQLKSQLKGSLLLGLEKMTFRMNRMAIGHLYFDQILGAEELIDLVNQVKNEDIIRVSREIFSQKPSAVQVGNMRSGMFTEIVERKFHA